MQRAVFKSSLRAPEKIVALALLDHWSRATETFPSVARLGAWTSLDRTSVMRALRGLEEKGALLVTRRKGASNRYELGQLSRLPVAESDRFERSCGDKPVAESDQSACATSRGEQHLPVAESDLTSRGERHEGTHLSNPVKEPTAARTLESQTKKAPSRAAKAKKQPAPEIPMPADWQPTEAHVAFAAQHGLDLELEVVAFRGWAEGKSTASWNGTFTTRLANQAKWNRERARNRVAQGGPKATFVQKGTYDDDAAERWGRDRAEALVADPTG